MIKKAIITLSLLITLPSLALAYVGVENNSSKTPDQVTYTRWKNNKTTTTLRIDYYGNILPGENQTNDIGQSTHMFKTIYTQQIQTSTGIARANELFLDLPAKSYTSILVTAITTTSLVASGTTYIPGDAFLTFTQPSVPRNIIIMSSYNIAGVAVTTPVVSGTVYIAGLDSCGRSTYTYQSLVSTANATAGIGNIAWSYISEITISGVTVSQEGEGGTHYICIGTGDKIGLANDIASTGDIYHVSEAGTVTTTYSANATYNTIDFATDGTGSNDYTVRYIINNVTQLP